MLSIEVRVFLVLLFVTILSDYHHSKLRPGK
jgi:hypothetical protein